MNRSSTDSSAERAGRNVGRAWHRLMRLQHGCRSALTQLGLPIVAAKLVIAAVWILIGAVLLHYGVGVAVVAALVLVLVLAGINNVPNSVERENKWRMGYMGFGLYNSDGFRVDPHDPDRQP